jgi:Cys/Met metabolism PLP-dependent enzyme
VLECQVSHVIATDDLYGGTLRLFERVRRRSAGIRLTRVDMSDPKAVEAAIRPETRLIWVETPTNPMLKLVDLATMGAIGQRHGIWTGAGNSFASPYVQRPLDHGFSVVIHSTTKYLNGHSDVIGGMGSDAQISSPMRSAIQSLAASALSPTRTMLAFGIPGGWIGREPLEMTKTLSDMGGSSGARRRRGNPRPCRDRNRHQNSHAQRRSVRTPDGRSQGDQSRSVGSLDGRSRGGTRSSSIGQIRRKLRQAIPSPIGYPNPSPMHNTGHTRSNTLENNKDSLVSERGCLPIN